MCTAITIQTGEGRHNEQRSRHRFIRPHGPGQIRARRIQHHAHHVDGRPCGKAAARRAGIEQALIEDCYMGNCAHGAGNIGRGIPCSPACRSRPRAPRSSASCSSGLNSIRAGRQRHPRRQCRVHGRGRRGVDFDSQSWRRTEQRRRSWSRYPAIFMPMIDTADIVAKRYNVSREYPRTRVLPGIAAPHGRGAAGQQVPGRIVPMAR